ncbi:MAG: hypothetical protein ACUVXD_00355 [Thermodesulfobacteriota bacterium]
MANIKLRVDDEIIRKVRKIAMDENTTRTAMVTDFLRSVADREQSSRERAARRLEQTFRMVSRHTGAHSRTCEDLHGRHGLSGHRYPGLLM